MTEAARSEPPPAPELPLVERTSSRRARPSRAAPKWIHFRVSTDLWDQLETVQRRLAKEEVPASISSIARTILHQHVGSDPVMAEVEESISAVWAITQEVMADMVKRLHKELPDRLRGGVRKYYERRTERHTRAAAP
jgi:hypothetical protein